MTAADYRDSFEAKFTPEPNTNCWIWTASSNKKGYGFFYMLRKRFSAHRAAWRIFKGEIPAGQFVCHTCDTPPCVNPDHLFLGTASDNTRDSMRKGRYFRPYGERSGAAKLTEKQVEQIRHLIAGGMRQDEIAQRFGVSKTTVTQIKDGSHWKDSKSHADKLAEASKTLAMMALQSDRYTNDAEYRDATDNTLARVAAYESEAK